MASRTAWTAGNGVGLTWTSCFASADLQSLAYFSSVMSSSADIANDTYLDQYADVACQFTIASSTIAAGAYMALYLLDRYNIDGTNTWYGGGLYASGGTQSTTNFLSGFVGSVALDTRATVTLIPCIFKGIVLPPRPFRFGIQNGCGFTLSATAGSQRIYYTTYNVNLNN